MEKTRKQRSINKILTLMLAFVMVFTGMGIGSWGVSEAWADESQEVILISISDDGGKCEVKRTPAQGYKNICEFIDDERHIPIYIVQVSKETESLLIEVSDKEILAAASYNYYNYFQIVNGKLELGRSNVENLMQDFSDSDGSVHDNLILEEGQSSGITVESSNLAYIEFSSNPEYPSEPSEPGCIGVYGLFIEFVDKDIEVNDADKKKLTELIQNASGIDAGDYYREGDRYNGKCYSERGFWLELQTTLTEAKAFFVGNNPAGNLQETITKAQIEEKCAELQSGIENLISTEEANTTDLYEAIEESKKIDTTFSYNADNLAVFQEKKAAAEQLFANLFSNGKATSLNTSKNQEDILRVAQELLESFAGDKMIAEISTKEQLTAFLNKKPIGLQARLTQNITLSDYTIAEAFNGVLDGNGHTLTIDANYKGLVGTNNGTICNLTISGEDLNAVPAICGINKGTIENCCNTANLRNTPQNVNVKGALCNANDETGIIRSCYNTGKLSGQYLGGICGQNTGLIENCFNTGLIDAEREAGGIVWRNHNNLDKTTDSRNAKSGTIKNCYNFNVMHHTAGWNGFYGSYIEKNLGPICGNNEKKDINVQQGTNIIVNEGTVENSFYLDAVITNKPNGKPLSIALSDVYLAQKKDSSDEGAGTASGTAIAGWTEKDSDNSIFTYDTDYYVFYDQTNEHFIAVIFDDEATSAVIDAAKPSEQSERCTSAAGDEKEFYLVKVPTGTKTVQFTNTETIIDYAAGYTNRYLKAYLQLDHHGTTSGAEFSRKFVGTSIQASDVSTILNTVSTICGSDTATYAFVETMLSGTKTESSIVTPGEKTIQVKFRFIGATKSISGNYDAKTNKDSQYVTWIATRTYSLKDGSSVGDLLKLAIKESGIKTVGENNNYVSGVYAPDVLGNYYLAEFTNGVGSGWMYTVNGKHPSVGLNGYYLKGGESVIWHYVNDYRYEVSDWFEGDSDYPNQGDSSTWDPWLKVPDVDPTKDTPTTGGAEDTKTENVTTDTKTGTTTAPTEVKVTEKANADGTKEKVAEAKVTADNQKEILKQAKANKSKEIILSVATKAAQDATKAEVTLDKSFIDSIVKDTDAKLTVKTPFGDKTYTQDELKALSEAVTTGSTVTITVEKAAEEPTVDVKALTAKLTPVARSAKTAKKNVKVTVSFDKQDKEILSQLKEAGYTVKYRFYRSTKKSAGYKSTVTKKTATYTNTSGKKGTKYFYKVQVRVYDENGKLVAKTALKQCKYASRTWTKAK